MKRLLALAPWLFCLLFSSSMLLAQAFQVKDIHPGGASSNSDPRSLICFDGLLYFEANDGTLGRELYQSDGTNAGTVLLKDIRVGGASGIPEYFAILGNTLFFAANDGVNGGELWSTDGTPGGTNLFKDIKVGGGNSDPSFLTVVNGLLFFSADENATGRELYISDGTVGGTVLLKDINPGAANSAPDQFVKVGNKLFFEANDGTNGRELWMSDGTALGTNMVKDLNPGGSSSNLMEMTAAGGKLFFVFNDGVNGKELWVSDGTNAGTVMVKDIRVGGSSNPEELTEVGAMLMFAADDNVNGNELWISDGTNAGTVMVKDIRAGAANSNPKYLTNLNGVLIFSANNGVNGEELWRSDGTLAGTLLVKDIRPGGSGSGSQIKDIYAALGTVYFEANETSFGQEPWKSDGTNGGTVNIDNINPPPGGNGSDPDYFTRCGPYIFFAARDGVTGIELWRTMADGDVTPPVISTCPVMILDESSCVPVGALDPPYSLTLAASDYVTFSNATNQGVATDNEGITSVSYQDDSTGTCPIVITRTWIVGDAAGNTSSCEQTIEIDDVIDPIIPMAGMIDAWYASQADAEAAALSATEAIDDCTAAIDLEKEAATQGECEAIITVTVTDLCGNMTTTMYNTRIDNTPPLISCPGNQIQFLDDNCETDLDDYTGLASASDNCQGIVMVSQNPIPGTVISSETTVVITLTATDECGHTNDCTFEVSTEDNTPPVPKCEKDKIRSLNANCEIRVPNVIDNAKATDNCSTVFNWSQDPVLGTKLASGEGMTHTVTVTVDDGNGNSATCTVMLTGDDTTPPVPKCEKDKIRKLNANCEITVPDVLDNASATDNCVESFIWNQDPPQGTKLASGEGMTHTVTVTVDDGNGNSATCTVLLTGDDMIPPTPACEMDQTISLDEDCMLSVPDLTDGSSAVDNCSNSFTWGQSLPEGTLVASGEGMTHTITLTVDDGNGNSNTCTVILTGDDMIPPDITCGMDQTISLDEDCKLEVPDVTYGVSADDNCANSLSFSQSPINGSLLPSGEGMTHTITVTVDDGNGNTNTCTVVLTGNDEIVPVPTCEPPQTRNLNANCKLNVPDLTDGASATDNCVNSFNWSQDPAMDTKLVSGEGMTHTVTVTVDDGNGNSNTCTVILTGDDKQKPVPTCEMNQTILLDEECELLVPDLLDGASATDNCSNNFSWSQNPVEDTYLSSGEGMTHTITVTVDDGNGNSQTCTVVLTGDDDTPPVPTCEMNQTINLDEDCQLAVPDLTDGASATDNCSNLFNWSQSPDDASFLSSGEGMTHTVTVTVDDGNGNTNTCTVILTGDDTTPADPTCEVNQTVSLDEDCMLSVPDLTDGANAEDNCSNSFTWGQSLPSGTLLASGEGNTHTITVTVDDGNGNSSTCVVVLTGDDDTPPVPTCEMGQTLSLDEDCKLEVPDVTYGVSADDNCANSFTWSQSPVSGSLLASGEGMTHTITVTVDDGNGNTNTCSVLLTGDDEIDPVPVCADPQMVSLNEDCDLIVPDLSSSSMASDNCSNSFSWSQSPMTGTILSSSHGMTHTITLTADDGNGNSASCTTVLTGKDDTNPTLDCPASINYPTTEGLCEFVVLGSEFDPECDDNCGVTSKLYSLSGDLTGNGMNTLSGIHFPKGQTTVSWEVSDAAGLTAVCSYLVTIYDNEPPQINCPPNINVITLPNQCSVPSGSVPLGTPIVSDNCGVDYPLTNNSPATYPLGVTQVKWTVKDSAGNKNTCNQKVTVSAYNCGIPSNVVSYDITFDGAKVSWTSGVCNTGYQLRIRKQIAPGVWGPYSSWENNSGPGNIHQFSGLDEDSYYHFQIRAKCGSSNSTNVNGFFSTPASGFLKREPGSDVSVEHNFEQAAKDKHLHNSLDVELNIFPNPAGDECAVAIFGFEQFTKILVIYDLNGRTILELSLSPDDNMLTLDLKKLGLSNGLYILKVSDSQHQKMRSFIVHR